MDTIPTYQLHAPLPLRNRDALVNALLDMARGGVDVGDLTALVSVLARAPVAPVRGDELLQVDALPLRALPMGALTAPAYSRPAQHLTEDVKQERQAIRDALAATRGNQSAAAAQLGMSRRTFLRRMAEYGVQGDIANAEGVNASAELVAAAPGAQVHVDPVAERQAIVDALGATRWDPGAAADQLGMTRRYFYRRMTEYGLLEGAKPRGIPAQRLRQEAVANLSGSKVHAAPPKRRNAVKG